MIGNNINELIAIAESQSDERLAQELNPQTETGMLGPTWLPAAELSFREKMRSGAQAQQQQNNGSIIDQLAQQAMPPQMMPQGMPPQGMPPQGMMPQQPMPQQMPPQQPMPPQMMEQNAMASGGMASGGIVNYANGGQITLDDLLNRTFQDYSDPTQADLYQKTFPRDTTYDTDPFGLDKYTKLREAKGELPLTDRQTLDNVTQELLNRETAEAGTEAGTGVEPETANTNKTYAELLAEVGEIDSNAFGSTIMPFDRNLLPDTIKNIATGAAGLPEKIGTGYVDLVKKAYGINETEPPEAIQALTEIQEQAVTGGLPPNTYYDPVNSMIIDKATGKNIDADTTLPDLDPTIDKEQIAVTGDNNPIVTNPSTIITAGGNAGLTDDVYRGQKQVLSEQMEKILNPLRNKDGQMDRKWLAIAAGAFNAAQKGAPTLMAGLADLGGGVTEQLQSLDKEDQERAIALMAIYQKQMQLDETARGHDLTYDASMNKNQLDLLKDAANRAGKTATSVLNSTKAWDAAKKNKTLGEFGSSDFAGSVIDYSEQGVSSAQLQYNELLSKIRVVEEEIMDDIDNFDPSNAEHMKEVDKELKEHLNDNPDQKMIYNNYWINRGYEEEGKLVPFDMTTSLRIQPRKG